MNPNPKPWAGSKLLLEKEVADRLRISISGLRHARLTGQRKGHLNVPPFLRIGKGVRYPEKALDEWLASHHTENPPAIANFHKTEQEKK